MNYKQRREMISAQYMPRKTTVPIYYVVTSDISSADPSGDAIAWLKTNATFLKQDTGIYLFSSK